MLHISLLKNFFPSDQEICILNIGTAIEAVIAEDLFVYMKYLKTVYLSYFSGGRPLFFLHLGLAPSLFSQFLI